MAQHDLSGKHLVEQYAEEWARWILKKPTIRVVEKLSETLKFVGREGDVILLIDDDGEEFILHIELQYRFQNDMPVRVLVYYALESQALKLPVVPVVVYFRPPSPNTIIDTAYHAEFRGLTAHLDFLVVRLWEVDVNTVLGSNDATGLLPLVPLMSNVDEGDVIQASRVLRLSRSNETLQTILAMYATMKFGDLIAQKLLRERIAMLDEMLLESPFYEKIIEKGMTQGIEQGIENSILTVIETRFGVVTDDLNESVRMVDDLNELTQLLSFSVVAPSLESVEAYIADIAEEMDKA